MIEVVYERGGEAPFRWLDVTAPDPKELKALAREHGFHPLSVADCLEPGHLPKLEKIEGTTFVLLRAFDESAPESADTAQALTRKIALFQREGLLVTIHRVQLPWLEPLKARLAASLADEPSALSTVALEILAAVLDGYWRPLEAAELAISSFEELIFDERADVELTRRIYKLKRRVTVIRWMARHTLEILKKAPPPSPEKAPFYTDMREQAEALYFAADETADDATTLLNTQLGVSAQQTNEVLRVLTVFSVFFLPLTLVAGIYGMNFEYMPELKWRGGYPLAISAMLLIGGGILAYAKSRRWLR